MKKKTSKSLLSLPLYVLFSLTVGLESEDLTKLASMSRSQEEPAFRDAFQMPGVCPKDTLVPVKTSTHIPPKVAFGKNGTKVQVLPPDYKNAYGIQSKNVAGKTCLED